jgi:hypothetical protein
MLEVLGILGILLAVGVVIGIVALVVGLLKLMFKIVLIPVALAFKLAGFLIGFLVLLVVGPVLLGLGAAIVLPLLLLAIPLLIIGGILWAGFALVT